jgi:Uma2 family endonuclease
MELMNVMKIASSQPDSISNTVKMMKISYEDFLAWCDEDTWAEWVDGEIVMVSPASKEHQRILSFFVKTLGFFIESHNLGELIPAPFQMKLGPDLPGREPDILFVSTAHLERLKDTFLDGPADMVMEIISEESVERDRGKKFIEYGAAGIPEYWLIDPLRQEAEFYRLGSDNRYHLFLPDKKGIYRSEIVTGFWLRVSWLWQNPLPHVAEVWRELGLFPDSGFDILHHLL